MNRIEILRWLILLLMLLTIVTVIALLLTLILGIAFALLYLVPNGIWTERSMALLWLAILSLPVGFLIVVVLALLDRRLARQTKSHKANE